MSPSRFCTLVFILFATVSGFSHAGTDGRTAESLMRASGLWQQLDGTGSQIKEGFFAGLAQSGFKPSERQRQRMEQNVDHAFAADRLRAAAAEVIEKEVSAKHLPELMRWYSSVPGVAVTKAEEAATANQTDFGALMREGTKRYEICPDARKELIDTVITAGHVAEGMAGMTINMIVAVQQGVAKANPSVPALSREELIASLQPKHAALVAGMLPLAKASLALAYQGLSNDELAHYGEFLKSASGQHFSAVGILAINAAFVSAAENLGAGFRAAKDGPDV